MSPATNEERLGVVEAGLVDVRTDIREVRTDIREIHDTLAGRPSWAVATLLAILSSSTAGLIVALASQLGS